jgi:hypothetical protein
LTPLEKARHTWIDELPNVLRSLWTMPNAATQETLLFLVHGAKAVLPIEIEHNSLESWSITKRSRRRRSKTMLMQLKKPEMWYYRE